MRHRVFRLIALSALVAGALIVACGDDDDMTAPTSTDGGVDSSAVDSNVVDSAANPDTGFYDPLPDAGSPTDADAPDGADATPPYVTKFCQDYLAASLTGITNCCPNDLNSTPVLFLQGFDEFALISCTQFYTLALQQERVHYLPQMATTCLQNITYKAADCPDAAPGYGPGKTDPTCEAVFGGLMNEGDTCIGDQDCANQLPCQGDKCTAGATEAGAACAFSNSRDSDPGIFAQRKRCITGETCNGAKCVPPAKQGEDCILDEDCVPGLYCTDTFGGTCQPLVIQDAGGACDEDKFCNSGLTCQDGGCTIRLDAGSACTDHDINGTQCGGYCNIAEDASVGACKSFCGSN